MGWSMVLSQDVTPMLVSCAVLHPCLPFLCLFKASMAKASLAKILHGQNRVGSPQACLHLLYCVCHPSLP